MKFYYYYGVMGASKTANALMKKFSFEEHGRKVALIKPGIDTRYGKTVVKSRIGLWSEAFLVKKESGVAETLGKDADFEIIIADEAQFFTEAQIDELRDLADEGKMIMCYGLRTDYTGRLFEGSRRIMETCDTIREIQSMCARCGRKAVINARYDKNGIIYEGDPIDIGGEEKYVALCHQCWNAGRKSKEGGEKTREGSRSVNSDDEEKYAELLRRFGSLNAAESVSLGDSKAGLI